ncbi:unnamed protein product, partial [Closterium sp. Yama58-4]
FHNLLGTDYSEAAVQLAQQVAEQAGLMHLQFQADDVLDSCLPSASCYMVVDKGTFDAVRLHPQGSTRKISYKNTVARLLVPNGLLVITSCNSTVAELTAEFAPP